MDQIKIGKFIAALRKEKCLTQEQLGEKLGVTNKTISRWENGNYMPDVEMLSLLSKEFGVSINELISGERLLAEDFKKAADNNLVTALNNSTFTLKDKDSIFQEEMAARTYFNYRPVRCGVDRYYNMDSAEITRQRLLCAFGCNRQYACYTFLCGTV